MNATLNFVDIFIYSIINKFELQATPQSSMQPCKQIRKNLKNRLPILPPPFFQKTKNIHDSISKNFTSHITAPPERPPFQMQTYKKHFKPPKNHHTFFPKKTHPPSKNFSYLCLWAVEIPPAHILNFKEALCSSCNREPEKFSNKRKMLAQWLPCYSVEVLYHIFVYGFSQGLLLEM